MNNPLQNVPLNTKKVYVMCETYDGCEVYMPVDSYDDQDQLRKKKELQYFLDQQADNPLLIA